LMRQQGPPQQSIGNNGAQPQATQQFLAYTQSNQMGANQLGGQSPNMSPMAGNLNPTLPNPMTSGNQVTLQSQLQSQMSPMGQIGNQNVNQMGNSLQSQRFGGRPAPVSSPMGPPTPVSGPNASPRALPTPSPRPHHPPTSQSPHSVVGSGTPQLDILHSPQLVSDDSNLTPQEQLSKYVEQL